MLRDRWWHLPVQYSSPLLALREVTAGQQDGRGEGQGASIDLRPLARHLVVLIAKLIDLILCWKYKASFSFISSFVLFIGDYHPLDIRAFNILRCRHFVYKPLL